MKVRIEFSLRKREMRTVFEELVSRAVQAGRFMQAAEGEAPGTPTPTAEELWQMLVGEEGELRGQRVLSLLQGLGMSGGDVKTLLMDVLRALDQGNSKEE